jgi:hypothetical protein
MMKLKYNHHQTARTQQDDQLICGNSKNLCTRQEEGSSKDDHYESVKAAYSRITRNNWSSSDRESYVENAIGKIQIERVVSVLETVACQTPAKINSFRYFVKEILAVPDTATVRGRRSSWEKLSEGFGTLPWAAETILELISSRT